MMETPNTAADEPSSVAPEQAPSGESSSAVGDVLAQVKERGFITTGEIFAAFPDLEPDTNELRELWEMFESRGIKVLDEIAEELQLEDQRRSSGSPTEAPAAAPAPRRRATEAREHRPSGATRSGSSSARPASDNENADAELAAVRSASARVTHSEG